MEGIDHLKNYIRVKRFSQKIEIEVCWVKWEGSHNPILKWKVAKVLQPDSPDHEINLAVNNLEKDSKYFLKCTICKSIQLVGYMFDESICQTCASTKHGVVY